MKKSIFTFFTFFIIILFSCKKDSLDEVAGVAANLQLNFAPEIKSLGLSYKDAEVTLTNKTDGRIIKGISDASGLIVFESVTPGNYSVVAALTISAKDYQLLTGTTIAQDIVFNGSLETNIVANSGTLTINLQSGAIGDWVIKQIYYGGSSTTNGAVFRDQFIEIYNNSNQVLYADSLYISQIFGKNTRVSAVDTADPAYLSNGQYNWANAIGMNVANPNSNYVYMKSLLMIPGNGKQYPVQPGASIIIAQNAQNHKASYVGSDGKPVSVKNPELTIDLSNADFEAYYGDLEGINPLASDTDNPLIPNVKVFFRGGDRDLILNNNGYEGIVIFKSKTNPTELPGFPSPEIKAISNTTTLYKQLPINLIIDAVDIAHTTPSSRAAKRMPDAIDAGFTFTLGGAYSSHAVIRTTSKTIDGRRILKDTNNSTEDFVSINMADPSKTVFK
ncbi:DUF4876 domain-containing protein [Pedobacter flavus]|uniref:DUF4876 domain-containing protein n=1 Tax=Pedobacter flavus TaxID=3113906 RepID=A0ABU7H318_9SPHI|nr:DUF4876 domain-containing protein [Pedobacter sp. VNH31]MEE1885714.1 DUF4876 domain-containing protein [Pedobacter sp. VNH31]